MRRFCFIIIILVVSFLFTEGACATDKVVIRSEGNGQFIVSGYPFVPVLNSSSPTGVKSIRRNSSTTMEWPRRVRFDPAIMSIFCQRIKHSLLDELGMADNWKGVVEIELVFFPDEKRPIRLSHRLLNDGFHTWMEVPDETDPQQVIRTVVQVLLLEIANRTSKDHAIEVPLWLSEGLTNLIIERCGAAIIPLPETPQVFTIRAGNPTNAAKERLKTVDALEFSVLANPGPEDVRGVRWFIYQDSCMLLTYELLNLPNGRLLIQKTLANFKNYSNWQNGFLEVWNEHFPTLIDLEKWWALTISVSRQSSGLNSWEMRPSLEKLDEILSTSLSTVNKTFPTDSRPSLELQSICLQWSFMIQVNLYNQIVAQLKSFELVAEPLVASLAGAYRAALEDYVRRPSGILGLFSKDTPSRSDVRVLIKVLKHLDQERDKLKTLCAKREEAARAAKLAEQPAEIKKER